MNNDETVKELAISGSVLNDGLGWIDADLRKPDFVENEEYSLPVFAAVRGRDWKTQEEKYTLMTMVFTLADDGWAWMNTDGRIINYDPEWDDDYAVEFWHPITIPNLPTLKPSAGVTGA